jgi:hypothetical protein
VFLKSSTRIEKKVEVKYEYVEEGGIRFEYDPQENGYIRVHA